MNKLTKELSDCLLRGPHRIFINTYTQNMRELQTEAGDTILMLAIRKQRWPHAEHILNLGADVTPRNKAGNTALLYAVYQADIALCRRLIALGADVNATNNRGMTPLLAAAMRGRVDVAELLIAHGASLHHTDIYGRSASMLALLRSKAEMVAYLAEKSVSCCAEHQQIVENLVQQKRLNGHSTYNPYLFAAVSGDTQVLEAFLKLGFIPYKNEIWAAIQQASQRGNTEILTGLFTCCKNDWQPVELADLLLLAVKNNCLPLASAVVEQGADVNSSSFEKSLLFYTLSGDKRDMFVFLCEHGCTCESMEDMLSYAFRYTALRISEYIRANCLPPPPPQEETSQADAELSHGSPGSDAEEDEIDWEKFYDNLCSSQDKTPLSDLDDHLITAAFEGNLETVCYLLEAGANANACDIDDKTPFNQALKRGLFYQSINFFHNGAYASTVRRYRQIIELLLEHGATLHAVEKHAALPSPAIQNAIEDIYNSRRSRYYHHLISEKLITDRDLAIRLQSMLPRTLSFI